MVEALHDLLGRYGIHGDPEEKKREWLVCWHAEKERKQLYTA
jgi:hypothetical protein